jgi:hypothetical protein
MIYLIVSAPMQTTAPPSKLGTTTTTKTILQVKLLVPGSILDWGTSYDGYTAATPLQVEGVVTGSIAATVTATAAADITGFDAAAQLFGSPTSNFISVGVNATGYNASAEGTTTTAYNADGPVLLPSTGPQDKQVTPGQEYFLLNGELFRIRVTAPTAVNMYAWCKIGF